MPMSLRMPADVEERILQLVENGHFRGADEALRKAVQLLDDHEQRLQWLRAAVAAADEQIERGEGIPYTPELLEEIDREVDELIRRGHKPSPDVCP
jgi:antitoxin ParD1/3/4